MSDLKENIKDFVGDKFYQIIKRQLKPNKKNAPTNTILLLPPSDLDGSFGDELMVASFIKNFASDKKVIIYTDHKIERSDFLSEYPQVSYQGGFHVRNYNKWAETLRKVDAIFIIGADALDGAYSVRHSMRYIRMAEMANLLGKKVYFSGFSISKKTPPEIYEAFRTVSKFAYLKARDVDSYQRLVAEVNPERVIQVSDMAFVCPELAETTTQTNYQKFESWTNNNKAHGDFIFAFCPNSIQAEKIGLDKYLNESMALLQAFNKAGNGSVVFLYHDIRPLCGELSDKDISQLLFEKYNKAFPGKGFFVEDLKNGPQLKSFLHAVDATITGRMHFGISGIEAGKPMFGVCYANKFEGMLRLFDINPDCSLVDYTEMDKGQPIVDLFLQNLTHFTNKIVNHLDNIKKMSLLNGGDIR